MEKLKYHLQQNILAVDIVLHPIRDQIVGL